MDRLYRLGEAARLLGVHPVTIRRWVDQGRLRALRTVARQRERRIPESELSRLRGERNEDAIALYARVSGHDQKAGLHRQLQALEQAYQFSKVYRLTDTASGLKATRKGLLQILHLVQTRQVRAVAVTWPDRLTRFGFEYLKTLCESSGVALLVLNGQESKEPEQELVDDLLALVASFAGKLYGLRSHKVKQLVSCVAHTVHHSEALEGRPDAGDR